MKITNLKDKMVTSLPFDDVWLTKDETGYPACEVGYVRADYADGRLYNTCWPVHKGIASDALIEEFNAVMDAFRRSFKDLSAMSKWCHGKTGCWGDEFNAYYVGKHGNYWFRMITRRGDYNLYLHCFKKEAA